MSPMKATPFGATSSAEWPAVWPSIDSLYIRKIRACLRSSAVIAAIRAHVQKNRTSSAAASLDCGGSISLWTPT